MIDLRGFLSGALKFSSEEIRSLGIMRATRTVLPVRTLAHNEVRVIFRERRDRERVAMRSRHLGRYIDPETRKPTAGFRMDVPDYLASEFKLLEETGYQLRDEYGKKLRKYIKYDHAELSLFLEISFNSGGRWHRITPRMARDCLLYTSDAADE